MPKSTQITKKPQIIILAALAMLLSVTGFPHLIAKPGYVRTTATGTVNNILKSNLNQIAKLSTESKLMQGGILMGVKTTKSSDLIANGDNTSYIK